MARQFKCISCERVFIDQTAGFKLCLSCNTIQVQPPDSLTVLRASCKNCGTKYQASASLAGKAIGCGNCGQPVRIPKV